MYIIIECDGVFRWPIAKNNKANQYEEPKKFNTKKEAQSWIDRHTYKGMSHYYEIKEVQQ